MVDNYMSGEESSVRKLTNNEIRKNHKYESSWGRIIQHIESDKTFAAISAYADGMSERTNKERHENLRRDIRAMGYGYIEMDAGYTYSKPGPYRGLTIEEESFFIPEITREEALELGRKYDQESIIFKDKNQFAVLLSDSGAVDLEFDRSRGPNAQFEFDPEVIKIAFSALKKGGSQYTRGKHFAFRTSESYHVRAYAVPTRSEVYRAQKERTIPKAEAIDLEEYVKAVHRG